jgi:hypothetical protein
MWHIFKNPSFINRFDLIKCNSLYNTFYLTPLYFPNYDRRLLNIFYFLLSFTSMTFARQKPNGGFQIEVPIVPLTKCQNVKR